MSRIEGIPILTCMYETASAIGTVGMTMGITPQLGTVSRCIIIFLMIFGRVGGLTMVYATLPSSRKFASKLPQEQVNVG
ncbi:MAG: potassium transporter TrkG [Erysipelotrichaceae bacterium]|nr:potassium transporter TrkG [Erysipelotrichaceae bacterium]